MVRVPIPNWPDPVAFDVLVKFDRPQVVNGIELTQWLKQENLFERIEEEYVPKESDKAWLRSLLDHLNDGGIWGWFDSGIAYQIDKTNKVVAIVRGNPESQDARIGKAVWNAIGWRVMLA